MYTVSHILLEAGEKISSARSPHANGGSSADSLDEITGMASSVRVRPIRQILIPPNQFFPQNRFLSAACKTYSCVQKKVFLFLRKVQASASPEEDPYLYKARIFIRTFIRTCRSIHDECRERQQHLCLRQGAAQSRHMHG